MEVSNWDNLTRFVDLFKDHPIPDLTKEDHALEDGEDSVHGSSEVDSHSHKSATWATILDPDPDKVKAIKITFMRDAKQYGTSAYIRSQMQQFLMNVHAARDLEAFRQLVLVLNKVWSEYTGALR